MACSGGALATVTVLGQPSHRAIPTVLPHYEGDEQPPGMASRASPDATGCTLRIIPAPLLIRELSPVAIAETARLQREPELGLCVDRLDVVTGQLGDPLQAIAYGVAVHVQRVRGRIH